MMIFILASGYLFTIYLLLALAKRAGKQDTSTSVPSTGKEKRIQKLSVTPNVTEASSIR